MDIFVVFTKEDIAKVIHMNGVLFDKTIIRVPQRFVSIITLLLMVIFV